MAFPWAAAPSIALLCLDTMGPILWVLLQLPRSLCSLQLFSTGCSSGPGPAPVGLRGLHLLQPTSTAAPQVPPWQQREICSVWCPWAAEGQPAPPWVSPGLQGAAALCPDHLLPSLGCPQGCFSPVSSPSHCRCTAFSLSLKSITAGAVPAALLCSQQPRTLRSQNFLCAPSARVRVPRPYGCGYVAGTASGARRRERRHRGHAARPARLRAADHPRLPPR